VLKEIYTGRGFFLGEVKPIQKPPSENIRALWERINIYRSVYVTLHSSSPNYLFAKFFSHLHKKTNSCTSLQIRLKSEFSFQTIFWSLFWTRNLRNFGFLSANSFAKFLKKNWQIFGYQNFTLKTPGLNIE